MAGEAQAFWEGCAAGEIRYQRCTSCGARQFYPRAFCARDGQPVVWSVSAGHGTVYAKTVVYRPPSAAFAELAPYAVLLIEMDEGFRLMAHGDADLEIGDRVRAGFREHADRRLPYFSTA